VIFSFILFPITLNYHSPALIIRGVAEGIIVGSFILFTLQFLSSLVLGRAFCGWVCPGAGLQDTCALARDRRIKGGNWFKYVLWAPWIGIIVFPAIQAGGLRSIDPIYMTKYGISVLDPQNLIVYFFFVLLIFAMALLAGKRAFCHTVCWMAPFMVIGRKLSNAVNLPSLRLKADREKCVNCKKCDKGCPMSLDVSQMVGQMQMENSECILCGTCVDVCSSGTISFAFRSKKAA